MTGEPPPEPRSAGTGLLHREIWPRTIRSFIAAVWVTTIAPLWRSRSHRRRIEAHVATFDLPAPITALVCKVVRATRLWPGERMDVAKELCSHFADGLGAGQSPEQIAADFGDPIRSAKLIRAAKLRCRPLWWKSFRWSLRSSAALILLLLVTYGWLAARYFWGSPVLRHNYAAEFNAPILATPKEQRAWPMYIQAIRELGPTPAWFMETGDWPASTDDSRWGQAVEFLHSHEHALGLVRTAAAMPTLGYMYSNVSDPDYMHAMEVRSPPYKYDPTAEHAQGNPVLMGIALPHLGEMRSTARLLRFDALAAQASGDRARFVADLDAILDLGDQALRGKFLIDSMVGIAIGALGTDVAMQRLHDDAGSASPLLTDDDVLHIAHRFAAFGGGRIRINPETEGMQWEDMIQRVFSDDGHGGGHMIQSADAESAGEDLYREFGIANSANSKVAKAAMPLVAARVGSRAAISAQVKAIVAAMRRDDELPPWRADERTADAEYSKLYKQCVGPLRIAAAFADNDGGPFRSVFSFRDVFETQRAGVMTVCALRLYRSSTGQYPTTLETLVPQFLPTMPLDPFTGTPLRYKLIGDGAAATPLLYSIGVDQHDDGGVRPPNPADQGAEYNFRLLGVFRNPKAATPDQIIWMDRARGDWVLYPPAPAARSSISKRKVPVTAPK